MRTQVTELGLVLPKQWFEGVREVDIHHEDGKIVIIPIRKADPILTLGQHPVHDNIHDASLQHNIYLTSPSI